MGARSLHGVVVAVLTLSGCSEGDVADVAVSEGSSVPPLSACAPADPAQNARSCIPEERSLEYFDVWKSEFMARNGISEDYFADHISWIWTSTNCWNSGISFYVNYRITVDWAVIDRSDQFVVWLHASERAYQHLNIPRDQFLNLDQLRNMLDNRVFGSSVGPVVPLENLAHETCLDAVGAFQDSTESPEMLPTRIAYYVPGKIPREDGLVSGAFEVRSSSCWVE
jgi:hypothetical protein